MIAEQILKPAAAEVAPERPLSPPGRG